MIVSVYKLDEDTDTEFTTNGCGCCSTSYYLESQREQILQELKWNVKILKESCKALDIDFLTFVCED